jgi:DNA-binding CsgD family transcriptional regulator/pimeloyl-ACP methyl ester carboxylesterase
MPYMYVPMQFCHVQLSWEHVSTRSWVEAFSSRFRLVQMDPRGTGMSTRGLPESHDAEHVRLDMEAVADVLGLERFVLHTGGGPVGYAATSYAVHHSERVQALILQGARLDVMKWFTVLPESDWETFLYSVMPRPWDGELRRQIVELQKKAFGQDDWLRLYGAFDRADFAGMLSRLKVPTLVLNPRDSFLSAPDEAAHIAQLAHGSLVLVEGAGATGDFEPSLRAIESFLEGLDDARPRATLVRDNLSARELEVLRLVALGRTNPQIADELVISRSTVQNHVSSILTKAGLANRAEAVAYALRNGLS